MYRTPAPPSDEYSVTSPLNSSLKPRRNGRVTPTVPYREPPAPAPTRTAPWSGARRVGAPKCAVRTGGAKVGGAQPATVVAKIQIARDAAGERWWQRAIRAGLATAVIAGSWKRYDVDNESPTIVGLVNRCQSRRRNRRPIRSRRCRRAGRSRPQRRWSSRCVRRRLHARIRGCPVRWGRRGYGEMHAHHRKSRSSG